MQRRLSSSNNVLHVARACALGALVLIVLIFRDVLLGTLFSVHTFFNPSIPETYASLPRAVLATRLADAEAELARIRYQSLLYGMALEEQERLRALASLASDETVGVGRVVSRPPRSFYDSVLVSVPGPHQISVGDYALVQGVLVGTVERVSGEQILVLLFSSGGTTSDARVGEPAAIVSLRGVGGGAFTFDLPTSVVVAPGDMLTSAFHVDIPVAVVQSIATQPEQTTQHVQAHIPVSFSDFIYVTFMRQGGAL